MKRAALAALLLLLWLGDSCLGCEPPLVCPCSPERGEDW